MATTNTPFNLGNFLTNRLLHISHAATVKIAKATHQDPELVQALEDVGTALLTKTVVEKAAPVLAKATPVIDQAQGVIDSVKSVINDTKDASN